MATRICLTSLLLVLALPTVAGASTSSSATPFFWLSLGRGLSYPLGPSLRSGVPLEVECSHDCRIAARMVIARDTARRAGLHARTIGRRWAALEAGQHVVRTRIYPHAKRALRRMRRVRVTIHVAAVPTTGEVPFQQSALFAQIRLSR